MCMLTRTEQILINRHGALALTMDQLAAELQIKKSTLYTMIAEERCPIKTIGEGKLRRASIVNVAKWMDGE